MDSVDFRILEKFVVVRKPLFDSELVADFVQRVRIAMGNRNDLSVWMALVDRDKLGSEAKTDDSYARFFNGGAHGIKLSVRKGFSVLEVGTHFLKAMV